MIDSYLAPVSEQTEQRFHHEATFKQKQFAEEQVTSTTKGEGTLNEERDVQTFCTQTHLRQLGKSTCFSTYNHFITWS